MRIPRISYQICPKCAYQRTDDDNGDADICPKCGLVFSKWMKNRFKSEEKVTVTKSSRSLKFSEIIDSLLFVPIHIDPLHFYGRVLIWGVLVIWGAYFMLLDYTSTKAMDSFMHLINLVFHEAGHVIFQPLGWFMSVLGGSLAQLIMPLLVFFTFLIKHHDNFAASVGLWWFCQSLIDLVPYINDARSLSLPLLGGGTGADRPGAHDWDNILNYLGIVQYDHAIAQGVDLIAGGLLGLACFWGGLLLFKQYKTL